ncbi:hypothetical protein TWF481_000642 [Arthrobotrys musiformis]|uniref:Uncharacterized protein n=1 Tax=Arthrobotrys musiformis TaxID=47236 RepID=A0AAV9WND9_9PEZI
MHLQQRAVDMILAKNSGEKPQCAVLETGHVFRIENSALVYFLRKIGKTGRLTGVRVESVPERSSWVFSFFGCLFPKREQEDLSGPWSSLSENPMPRISAFIAISLGMVAALLIWMLGNWWGFAVEWVLIVSRAINIIAIRRRSSGRRSGSFKTGERGGNTGNRTLLIILSQDRWFKVTGSWADLEKATITQWLREQNNIEGLITGFATVIVYLAAVLVTNADQLSKILLICQLVASAGLLGICNRATRELTMHRGQLCVREESPAMPTGEQNLDIDATVDELIRESGRSDWAVKMGLLPPPGAE